MTSPDPAGWDQPGDDGVLDGADTLASDDVARDRLDAGIDPPDLYSAAEGSENIAAEARQDESLDQLLAGEEPEQSFDIPAAPTADQAPASCPADGPRARRLARPSSYPTTSAGRPAHRRRHAREPGQEPHASPATRITNHL